MTVQVNLSSLYHSKLCISLGKTWSGLSIVVPKEIFIPQEMSSYHWPQVLLQNVLILFNINVAIYRYNRPNTIPRDATPYHYFVPGLRCPGLNKVWSGAFGSLAPEMNLLVMSNHYFALIRKYYFIPAILNYPSHFSLHHASHF